MSKGKRNRAKSALTKKTPSAGEEFSPVIEQKLVAEQFHGPIPPPNILNGYEKLLPGAADRIISMAESETKHRQMMEKKAIEAEIEGLKRESDDTRRGQIFGLIIGLTAILSGTFTSVYGYPWAGTFIGAGGVAGLVSAFIAGRKADKDNKNESLNGANTYSPPDEIHDRAPLNGGK